ncbi:MAG: tetratricopeptide repeat protein, partial [Nitrospinota bacterium]
MRFHAKALLIVLGAALALFPACAARPPAKVPPVVKVPPKVEPSPSERMKGIFREAREAFEAGRHTQARRLLTAFILSYPESALSDDARLLLGRLHYGRGRYREAAEELERVPRRIPPSSAYKEARYFLGLSYFALGEKERAYPLLKEELSRTEDRERRARIRGMLGEIYLLRGEPLRAISELLESMREGGAAARLRARKQVAGIVEKELSGEELKSIINRYGRDFPAGIARFRLAQKHLAAGRKPEAKEALAGFLKLFPEHPLRDRALSLHAELLKALREDRGKIGVILPLSGPAARAGEHMLQGIRFALQDLGPKVDELGIKLLAVDSGGGPQDAEVAAKAVRELVLKHKVIALIGPLLSSSARAAAREAHELKVPLITPFAP